MDRHFVVIGNERRGRSNERGYTLVEVLVGGILVAIFAVTIFQVISQGSLMNRQQLLRRRSFQAMEQVLEMPVYSSLSPYYQALSPGNPVDTMVVVLDDCGGAHGADTLDATIKVRVDSLSFSYSGTVIPAKKVTATITYTNNGTSYQDSLQTLITLAGIN
jgi:hypothetical protein